MIVKTDLKISEVVVSLAGPSNLYIGDQIDAQTPLIAKVIDTDDVRLSNINQNRTLELELLWLWKSFKSSPKQMLIPKISNATPILGKVFEGP